MRTIVRCTSDGEIVFVRRSEFIPEREDPVIAEGKQFDIEIEEDEGTKQFAPHQLAELFSVDLAGQKLAQRVDR